ncbi:LOW QUALITY PROTEIN: uncharacterized protein At4g15970-like [Ananas comosus]|uniref:LOW QUALITY PROTEIN: uncharacterized protein At4g15970-like n=1 Tax=Ananas comosus TaxID=4615 RepID=A0A6P5EES5_ANACO|nr:LOW QUALITY PROTEIN: uncharacterized protein At4g15970-like [Ananas comosus]
MDDKTVILTTVNEAFAAPNSLLDLFLESFRIGEGIEHLLDRLIVVAMDLKAFDRCTSVHPHCFFHRINGTDFTSEKVFMTRDYIEIVWSKIRLQRRILELGYNFLFTVRVLFLWFRDPRRHISIDADLTTASDRFFGNPDSLRNWPNTGLFYVKSTEKTVAMLRKWDEARAQFPPNHEQNVFDRIKGELVGWLGVKIRFVDTAFWGGFCEYGNDLNKICTMHANCCVILWKKLQDLRGILEEWKKFTSLSPEEKRRGIVTWWVPGSCIR